MRTYQKQTGVVDDVPVTSDFPARFPAQRSAGKKLSLLFYGDLPARD
jgi:hypothetical protein